MAVASFDYSFAVVMVESKHSLKFFETENIVEKIQTLTEIWESLVNILQRPHNHTDKPNQT